MTEDCCPNGVCSVSDELGVVLVKEFPSEDEASFNVTVEFSPSTNSTVALNPSAVTVPSE